MANENSHEMEGRGTKREFRIDSEDSARPKAELESETRYFAQGLKPKARVVADVAYEELDEWIAATKTSPASRLILRTTTYDDGTQVDTTVGEQNEGYQDHLRGGSAEHQASSKPTRMHKAKRKPEAPKKAAKKG